MHQSFQMMESARERCSEQYLNRCDRVETPSNPLRLSGCSLNTLYCGTLAQKKMVEDVNIVRELKTRKDVFAPIMSSHGVSLRSHPIILYTQERAAIICCLLRNSSTENELLQTNLDATFLCSLEKPACIR